MEPEENQASTRFQTAMDLFVAGEEMMRLKLTRDNPELNADEIEKLLLEWLLHRPGAERGDCPGPPRTTG